MTQLRLGIVQRVLVPYRVPLFDSLAARSGIDVCVVAGAKAAGETIRTTDALGVAEFRGVHNRYLLRGSVAAYWQSGWRDWLEEWQPDVLIAEANPRCLSIRPMVKWMRNHGRPTIGWGLGAYSITPGLSWLRAQRRQAVLRNFAAMLAYSSRAGAQYRDAGFPEDRVFVCPNAATPRPAGEPPQRPAQRDGAPVVLFVGRLTQEKRVDALIEACALLAREQPEAAPELRIVGDGAVMDSLVALADSRYPRTKLLGALSGDALAEQFSAADVFVLPRLGGLAVQEAMSHGLPVIVGAADGTQYDLVRPDNGWVLPEDTDQPLPALLAATMRTALSDFARLRAMGRVSFAIVRDEVNVDRMVDVFLAAIRSVVDLGATPQSDTRLPAGA